MPINGYFDTIFASSGSVTPIPDAVQPDGSVSYEQGYGVNYTLNPAVNPSALNIEQTKFNQLIYDITSAIQYFQQGNAAAFITSTMNNGSPYTYPQYATVSYLGVTYVSLVAGNADTPPSAKWKIVGSSTNREVLSADRNYYVRTDGSNGNTGLVNNAGGAFLTIQYAINLIANTLDLAGFIATINVNTGNYPESIVISGPFMGNTSSGFGVAILGNNTTPANVVINPASGDALDVRFNGVLSISGVKLVAAAGNAFNINNGGFLLINNKIDLGACSGDHFLIQQRSGLSIIANYTISGGAANHWNNVGQSNIYAAGRTVTLTGTPAFTNAFAKAIDGASIEATGNTYTGSATGVLYSATLNGTINSGVTLPGNSAGSTATGGQYV